MVVTLMLTKHTFFYIYSTFLSATPHSRGVHSTEHRCAAAKQDAQNRDAYCAVLASLQCTKVQREAHSTKLTNLPEQITNIRVLSVFDTDQI